MSKRIFTKKHREKLSISAKKSPHNWFGNAANHPRWTGDKPSYLAVHKWMYRQFGLANKCEYKKCQYPRTNSNGTIIEKPKRFDWANISRTYKRVRSDWIMLCPSDHAKFDRGLIKI